MLIQYQTVCFQTSHLTCFQKHKGRQLHVLNIQYRTIVNFKLHFFLQAHYYSYR